MKKFVVAARLRAATSVSMARWQGGKTDLSDYQVAFVSRTLWGISNS